MLPDILFMHRIAAMILPSLVLLSAAVAAEAAAEERRAPSTMAMAADPARFARVSKNGEGEPAALQLAVATYVPGGDRDFSVDLVSAIHIGDPAYYQELNDRFRAYDAVLYELVIPDDLDVQQGGTNLIASAQIGMKNALGLAFQLDEIDYAPANFVHADLTSGMLAKSMADRGESLYVYFWRLVYASLDEYAKDPLGLKDWQLVSAMLSSRQDEALKVAMAYRMVETSDTPDILGGETGSAVIAARNEHAIHVLQEQLENGAERLAIFYGVAHMPDFEERLLNEMSLVKQGTEWVDAWRFTVEESPFSDGEEHQ